MELTTMVEALQQSPASEMYRTVDLIIDTGRQCVSRGKEEIPLPKLSFDLLMAIVRAAPNVVSLEVLMREVWPSLVVSPDTVSQRVKLLRSALGDDPHKPRYIAGLRGRGYRMLAPVTKIAPAPSEAPRGPQRVLSRDVSRLSPLQRRWVLLLLFAIAGLLAVVVIVLERLLDASRDALASSSSVTLSALPEHTVAVLPFVNLSGDAQNDFIALGIAEGVLHRLAAVRDLTLIARTSSFALQNQSTDAREIGLRLNARYLVGGSVQRAHDQLRVTAQLVDAASGAHVWSLRFDQTLDDIFAVEDEISGGVARALEVALMPRAHPFAQFGTEAYLAYMEGQELLASRTVANTERAIERFTRATEIAPDFAAAYVALANTQIQLAYLSESDSDGMLSPEIVAAHERADALLARALAIDRSLGEAYVLRADINDFRGDTASAEADFRKGLALKPNYGVGHGRFAEFLHKDPERFEEALAEIDKARTLDPLTPRHHYFKGILLWERGATDEAEALFLQALEVRADFYPALVRIAQLRSESHGKFAEAVKLAEKAVAIDGRAEWVRTVLADLYLELRDVAAARSVLQEGPAVRPVQWAPICLFTGKLQRAAELLKSDHNTTVREFDAYVLRDAALATGKFASARKEILALLSRQPGRTISPRPLPWRSSTSRWVIAPKVSASRAKYLTASTKTTL